jgi:hypothetical protein
MRPVQRATADGGRCRFHQTPHAGTVHTALRRDQARTGSATSGQSARQGGWRRPPIASMWPSTRHARLRARLADRDVLISPPMLRVQELSSSSPLEWQCYRLVPDSNNETVNISRRMLIDQSMSLLYGISWKELSLSPSASGTASRCLTQLYLHTSSA